MFKWSTVAAVALIAVALPAGPAAAADSTDAGLLPLIPAKAFFLVERPGHDAVHDAFAASNFGEFAANPAIRKFAKDTLGKIEQYLLTDMLEMGTTADPQFAEYRRQLRTVLVALAYKPAAAFALLNEKDFNETPGLGVLCLTGEHRPAVQKAVERLLAAGAPPTPGPGRRQPFTYDSGASRWNGVLWANREFLLTAEPGERMRTLREWDDGMIMVCWTGELLYIATNLQVADKVSALLSAQSESIQTNKDLQATLAATKLADWAFRWYFDIYGLRTDAMRSTPLPTELVAMGFDKVRSVGGTEGYADRTWTSYTYLHCPGADRGMPRLISAEGDPAVGLSMVPRNASIAAAGQIDKEVLMRMIREAAGEDAPPPGPTTRPAGDEHVDEGLNLDISGKITGLLADSDGHAGVYMTNLEMAVMGMIGGGDMQAPIGVVLQTRDAKQAATALKELIDLTTNDRRRGPGGPARPAAGAGADNEADRDEEQTDEKQTPQIKYYRGVAVETLNWDGPDVDIAALDDRLILAFSDMAAIAAIDAAKGDSGGVSARGRGIELHKLAGDGAAMFRIDLPALASALGQVAPLMMMANDRDSPLGMLPPIPLLARLLTQEVSVIRAVPDGLSMESRGLLPFANKVGPMSPMLAPLLFWYVSF